MAENTNTAAAPSPDIMSIVTSAVQTGLVMSGTVIGATAYMILFWRLNCYFGRPLGVLFAICVSPPATVPPKTPEEVKLWQAKVRNIFGGLMGGLAWFAAFMIEMVSITLEEERTKVAYPWSFWRVIIFIAKAGLEALVAISVTSGAVRVAGLG